MSPVVPKSFVEGSKENLDSEMTIVWFKITLITWIFPSSKSFGDHGAVEKKEKYLMVKEYLVENVEINLMLK